MKHEALQDYLQAQIAHTQEKLQGLTSDTEGAPLFKRDVFYTLHQHALDFLHNGTEPRIIAMPGLHGTGKTTLLAQLFLSLAGEDAIRIYLSVDEASKRFE